MLTAELFIVAVIVLGSALYLLRLLVASFRQRQDQTACSGCGCGRNLAKSTRATEVPASLTHAAIPAATHRQLR